MPIEEDDDLDIGLIGLRPLAAEFDLSPDTIKGWVQQGIFPRPIVAKPGSPLRWWRRDIRAWIGQRKRARNTKPSPRGRLLRGRP